MKNIDVSKVIDQCDIVSGVLKSLSHPIRLKILCYVIEGDRTVNELTEYCGIAQSSMSQFLGRMRKEGILSSRRVATNIYYGMADPKLKKLLKSIKEIYCK
ncbi:MAG: metalloregulator ArsR/SmtB family transcription factor [Bacteriovoracaceae bacterium]|nr:metalloregulator ArsR/SmtB family transcription factor [Bacteriovoracaceae bacterium]